MGGILVFLVWKHRGVASSATKDEKTRAALGIFAHYDKLLLYHSNTKYTHPITASLSLKIALVVEQLSTSPSPQTYVKPSRFSAFSFNFRPETQVRHFLRVVQFHDFLVVSFWHFISDRARHSLGDVWWSSWSDTDPCYAPGLYFRHLLCRRWKVRSIG